MLLDLVQNCVLIGLGFGSLGPSEWESLVHNPTSSVTFSKSIAFSEPQYTHLQNVGNYAFTQCQENKMRLKPGGVLSQVAGLGRTQQELCPLFHCPLLSTSPALEVRCVLHAKAGLSNIFQMLLRRQCCGRNQHGLRV